MDEYIDIVDNLWELTGKSALKSEAHKNGWYHNTVHIWFYTKRGDILLQQRSHKKKICPLLWDVSVAGHIDAGETIALAAVRETREEIGLEINANALKKIGVFCHEASYFDGAIKDNEFHHVYIAELKVPLKDLVPQPSEVEALKLVSIETFKNLARNSAINMHFVETNTDYYQFVLQEISNLIML